MPGRRRIRRCASAEWKRRALHVMRRRYYFQVLKAHVKLKQRWQNNYCITRIGAPDVKEFLCPETFYVARMSTMKDAVKFREYWYWCRRRSFEILLWLWELDEEDYCWRLHMYLKGFIVTRRPIMSEVERYESQETNAIRVQVFGEWRTAIYRDSDKAQICAL